MKKPINTHLYSRRVELFTKAFNTGDSIYSNRYAFINQFSFVAKKQLLIPYKLNSLTPMSKVNKYNPVKKNTHWNRKLHNPFTLGFIPNHPDIKIKTLTHTILTDSKNMRKKESKQFSFISKAEGCPKENSLHALTILRTLQSSSIALYSRASVF